MTSSRAQGILFNHECLHAQHPLIVRENGVRAVRTPADLVPLRAKGPSVQTFEPEGLLEVWDGEDWTPVTRDHGDPAPAHAIRTIGCCRSRPAAASSR